MKEVLNKEKEVVLESLFGVRAKVVLTRVFGKMI